MQTDLAFLVQTLFAKGGDLGEARFSEGGLFTFRREGERVVSAETGEIFSHPAPEARLKEAITGDELRAFSRIFQKVPSLEALLIQDSCAGQEAKVRITRESAAPQARFEARVGTKEQGERWEGALPLSARLRRDEEPLSPEEVLPALCTLTRVLYAVRHEGEVRLTDTMPEPARLAGVVPAVSPEALGAQSFRQAHGLRFAYLSGAMAGGIGSAELVISMGKAGCMGFFGAGGVPLTKVEEAIIEVKRALSSGQPFGFNLLHNPFEPSVEEATAALYVKHDVPCIDASAYMELTPAILYYRAKGLRALPDGKILAPHRVFAKVSRPEVAAQFLAPAPERLLRELVAAQKISEEEATLAARLPVAEDVTAEADSGGHTDRRPLSVLLPLMLQARDQAEKQYGYDKLGIHIRVGAAGGVAEPLSAKAALSLGADYLMTGSLNQASLEAGTSTLVKKMLLEADMADVSMAPAPDMFEMGVQVQVLKRGTLYAPRAQKLFELYKSYPSFEEVPAAEQKKVEKQILKRSFGEVWEETEKYWQARDPKEAERARQDGRHKMALCFRWYLGMASRWARLGEEARKSDFQIWCGPAMGAFNRWVKGSWLEPLERRSAPVIGAAILHGAAALARLETAASAGVSALPSPRIVSRPPAQKDLPSAPR